MQSITETPTSKGNIMVVDDNPANLKLLEDMLRQQHFEVQSFPLGGLALAAAEKEPPDLILLDVNMPQMNGYEVCVQLKSRKVLSDIPVIFVSALNETEDKVKGFRSGGADYVSKPFQFEEVQSRIETHLNLRRALQAERNLLENTLGGAVAMVLDLLQITSPLLVLRTHAIRHIAMRIIESVEFTEAWEFELAAMLCLLGCISLPDEIFENAYGAEDLTPEEDEMFRTHPDVAARLLSKVPRLETVAEMIGNQRTPDSATTERAKQGARMLNLALELDQKLYRSIDCRTAVDQLTLSGRFDSDMARALESYSPGKPIFETQNLLQRELRPSMVLDENVMAIKTKALILKEGVVLTPVWIERLENFAKSSGVPERIRVRVPSLGNVGTLSTLFSGTSKAFKE